MFQCLTPEVLLLLQELHLVWNHQTVLQATEAWEAQKTGEEYTCVL